MTNNESDLLREMVNVNWDMKQAQEKGYWTEAFHLNNKLNDIRGSLIKSMGKDAFDKLMDMGRKMFAPITS